MIRHARPADLAVVLRLLKEFDDSLDDIQASRAPVEVLARVLRYGIANRDPVLLAIEDGEAVGIVAWVNLPEQDSDQVNGLMLYVRDEFRNRGISRSLAQRAEEVSRDKGYRRYTCEVAAGNEAGLAAVKSRPGARLAGYTFVRDLVEEEKWQPHLHS